MTKLFTRVFASFPDDVKIDEQLSEKIALVQQFIHQENLDIMPTFQNESSWLFTVIACAASRVFPSNILGIQPGDAFTMRNVANLVFPFETGPPETKAALEFSVNTLQVYTPRNAPYVSEEIDVVREQWAKFFTSKYLLLAWALDRVGLDIIEQSFILKCMRSLKLERTYI
ncbi:beta carbonic anhydrase 5, chloroplastic-like isoform X2 [Spinacia oleracea]|nr:beta carbonic anhydrase 5, chloroplastic-like isoform X2 [Spinacia oleracea]